MAMTDEALAYVRQLFSSEAKAWAAADANAKEALEMAVMYLTEKIEASHQGCRQQTSAVDQRLTSRIESSLSDGKALMDERDRRVTERFEEHDLRYHQRFLASELALTEARQVNDLALSAALDAVRELALERDRRINDALGETNIRLREHVSQVRDEAKNALLAQALMVQQALDATRVATDKAEASIADRFHSTNEFRAQLTDQAARFITRTEAEVRISQNAEKIEALERRTREDMAPLRTAMDMGSGRTTGADKLWGYIVGAIGLAATVISVVIATRP